MNSSDLQALLERAATGRLLCVGDVMIDRYIHGEVGRISPEAPIPVMARRSVSAMLGGAGNVARNVAALGASVVLAGVVGEDAAAAEIEALAGGEERVSPRLITARWRPTTTKTRFVAQGQQLLRMDEEDDGPLSAEAEAALTGAIKGAGEEMGAILISDYAKGAVTGGVIKACLEAGARARAPVIVDPKGPSFAKYGPVDLIKPNARELALVTGLPVGSDAEAEAALASALEACEAKAILATRAAEGMSLAVRGRPVIHLAAKARAVFDVSGAGDTCLAALGVALGAGADLETAVALALLASGVVVGKEGTAVATALELLEADLSAHLTSSKVVALDQALMQVRRWRSEGLRIGFANGCFDILRPGHVAYLKQASAWCDRLIVGLNSDRSIRGLKGDGRPVNDLQSRGLVLSGLTSTALIVPFDEATPMALIEAIRPDVLVKGQDYAPDEVVGGDFVTRHGGEVKLAPLVEGYSTTAAIARMTGSAERA